MQPLQCIVTVNRASDNETSNKILYDKIIDYLCQCICLETLPFEIYWADFREIVRCPSSRL